jgi:hypothetical protein
VSACVCVLFFFRRLSSFSFPLWFVDGKLPPAVRMCVCVHKPDLLLPGSSNSRLISLAPCQSTACLPLRAPNFIWPAARASIYRCRSTQSGTRRSLSEIVFAKGERGPGATTSIYSRVAVINKLCHCQILSRDSDIL